MFIAACGVLWFIYVMTLVQEDTNEWEPEHHSAVMFWTAYSHPSHSDAAESSAAAMALFWK